MSKQTEKILNALDSFNIETPSWGYGDTGTRFGKFFQDAAAITIDDKLSDAGIVHQVTGCCPSVAVHVLWDFPPGCDMDAVLKTARKHGVRIGAINPNVFQAQDYKYGSLGNPDPAIRRKALKHILDSVELMHKTKSRFLSLWFADGSCYPGQSDIVERKRWFAENLKKTHDKLRGNDIMLVEYKPFEPAFYHTDIGDWGMAYVLCKSSGKRAKVLVDTGHHYQAQNIEQLVAWLLDEDMLGGFHFNDRRYADDDLTLGSIDPYQVFRIFHEIQLAGSKGKNIREIAYMVDQCHNLKNKVEETIQTAMNAQELWAKAALVDYEKLARHQKRCELIDAENCLRSAFSTDVRPAIELWRKKKGLQPDPLKAFRASGYEKRAAKDRAARRKAAGISQGKSFAF
jgi:L-rhamnose isomerase/sugar isomerase